MGRTGGRTGRNALSGTWMEVRLPHNNVENGCRVSGEVTIRAYSKQAAVVRQQQFNC